MVFFSVLHRVVSIFLQYSLLRVALKRAIERALCSAALRYSSYHSNRN